MTRDEHLLTIVAEEGVEVAQRATKAVRFGPDEVQPGQTWTNQQRIMDEFYDLVGVLEMLGYVSRDAEDRIHVSGVQVVAKQRKVEHYLQYSATLGTLV